MMGRARRSTLSPNAAGYPWLWRSQPPTHDSQLLEVVVDAVKPVRQAVGRPRWRSHKLHTDKGYDYPVCRKTLHRRDIIARIARRGIESSQRLGRYRYVIERTLKWASGFRRLQRRHERIAAHFYSFAQLVCAVV
jgi:lambda repressor-like predicted transcriptional regulator